MCITAKIMHYKQTNLSTQWYPVTLHAHPAPIARRDFADNEFTGSVAAFGKLTKLIWLYVEQNHDEHFIKCLNPF